MSHKYAKIEDVVKLIGPPTVVGGEIIQVRAHRSSHFETISQSHNLFPYLHMYRHKTFNTMSAPCRLAAGATRALERTAVPRIARRTFASIPSRTTSRCLREAQRPVQGTRTFTQSASRNKLKTIDQIRARNRGGVRLAYPIYHLHTIHYITFLGGSGTMLTVNAHLALQPHRRHPLRRIRCRSLGLLHIRERAHRAQAHS